MLRALLAAAMAPLALEQVVEALLKAVVGRLAEQSACLRSIGEMMIRLSHDVGAAVFAQMATEVVEIP
jgi:hypothetical protein